MTERTTLAATRLGLHRVAAYVVSPARRQATGNEISLVVTPGGFGTPPFGDDERLRVEGTRLVRHRGGRDDAAELTTLRAAAAHAGIEPDVAWAVGFDIPPPGDLDAPLGIDAAAAARLAAFWALAADALEPLRAQAGPDDAVTAVTLWPEHFDVAIDLGDEAAGLRATYGGSPGDGAHPEPYLYVAPWTTRDGAFWNDAAFGGASLGEAELRQAVDPLAAAVAFFERGRAAVAGG
jgi:hypothetical protein